MASAFSNMWCAKPCSIRKPDGVRREHQGMVLAERGSHGIDEWMAPANRVFGQSVSYLFPQGIRGRDVETRVDDGLVRPGKQ
jgi:hypothetical protein